jgi:hypothetical protein
VSEDTLTSSGSTENGLVSADLDNNVTSDGARNDDDLSGVIGEGGGQRCEGRDIDSCSSNTTFGSISVK